MKLVKINLQDHNQRAYYSEKLIKFEQHFNYPLGEGCSFKLSHGLDYFAFFEKMGNVSYFVFINDNEDIVGAACAVLRNFQSYKSWYLCDFKILPYYRGKKIYRYILMKYFFSHYLRSNHMFCINMSSPKNNKIFSHTKKIFKLFNVKISSRFLTQLTFDELKLLNLNDYHIVTNKGKKDIIINEAIVPLYHLIPKKKSHIIPEESIRHDIEKDAIIMLLNHHKMNLVNNEIEISYIYKGKEDIYISSADI